MARKTYPVTGLVALGVSPEHGYQSVPGLNLTAPEVRAGINGGGWHSLICEVCGDDHRMCPELRKATGRRH